MKNNFLFILSLFFFISSPSWAKNKSAWNCELFIKKIQPGFSYHGSFSTDVFIQVGHLPADEVIQKIGFYKNETLIDFGNSPTCNNKPLSNKNWTITLANPLKASREFSFNFMLNTVNVTSECLGYSINHQGTFFLETNKNTYWLNPEMKPGHNFEFDLTRKNLMYSHESQTLDPSESVYFNPARCQTN